MSMFLLWARRMMLSRQLLCYIDCQGAGTEYGLLPACVIGGSWEFHLNQAIVEFDELSDEVLVELVLSNSWVGKAGSYDLAGEMGEYARLVEGDEATVLGIASDAMSRLVELSDYEI